MVESGHSRAHGISVVINVPALIGAVNTKSHLLQVSESGLGGQRIGRLDWFGLDGCGGSNLDDRMTVF